MRKFHEAKIAGSPTVTVWGSGRPLREFLHVDDCADACLFLMNNHDSEDIVNIGVGEDVAIAELAEMVGEVVGFTGGIVFDPDMPDGTPRKLVDTSRINALGWRARTGLRQGLQMTYEWFTSQTAPIRD